MKNKTIVVAFLAMIFVFGSCAKKQVKQDIEGTWTVQEFLVNGEIFFAPSTNNSIVWTFNDGTLTGVTTYEDVNGPVTETDQGTYKIKSGGDILSVDGDEWNILELTSSKLVIQSESNGEIIKITFVK